MRRLVGCVGTRKGTAVAWGHCRPAPEQVERLLSAESAAFLLRWGRREEAWS